MSVNAVQKLLRDALDALETPNVQLPPAQAWIAPPLPGDAAAPQIYVWGAHWTERRMTGGRGAGGSKRRDYDVAIHIYAATVADDPNADSAFPLLIEAVIAKLASLAMPVQLTDDETKAVTQLVEVGERFEVTYGVPRSLQDQRLLWYNCAVTVGAVEMIIA